MICDRFCPAGATIFTGAERTSESIISSTPLFSNRDLLQGKCGVEVCLQGMSGSN